MNNARDKGGHGEDERGQEDPAPARNAFTLFFECCFPYVCPEPVLAKCSVLAKDLDMMRFAHRMKLSKSSEYRVALQSTETEDGLCLSAASPTFVPSLSW